MYKAQQEAIFYMGFTGNPAHIKPINLLTESERDQYEQFLEVVEWLH